MAHRLLEAAFLGNYSRSTISLSMPMESKEIDGKKASGYAMSTGN